MRTKQKMKDALKSTLLPSLHLSAVQKPAGCTDSKFGGIYYLPQGERIPLCPEGEPMRFLAQINFARMPHLEGFPRSGLLQFFLDTSLERLEQKSDDPDAFWQLFAVRYYPSPDAALQQEIELPEFIPARTVTTVTVNGEEMTETEYQRRLAKAQAQEEKPASVFMALMEGRPIPPPRSSPSAELRRNAKFHVQRFPGHLILPWLEGKMAFRSAAETAAISVGMDDLVSDLGYETICRELVTPDLVIRQSGYDLENNESALDALCWDFGGWGTKLGGHPAIRQMDCRLGQPDGTSYTTLLFQYDFTSKKELEADTFQFFIKPEDLAAAKFEDIFFCWHNSF